MKTNLIVNLLASIDVVEDTGDFICGGPVPGRGMRHLHVSPAEAHLYSIFSELSNIGLANLNVARDLNADEIILLTECGILTDDANVPERPLFACMLGDIEPIEPGNADIGSLTVNPTLEIQPFDLTNFRPMMQKNLSPYHATAWVSDPSTEMRWGYWLTPDETAFLDRIARGVEIGPDELDPPMLNRLTVAGILIDPNERPPREAPFRSAAEFFAIKGGQIQEIQAVLFNLPDAKPTGWPSGYGPAVGSLE